MKIAISGASGFVGSHLTQIFKAKKYDVIPLGRAHFATNSTDKLIEALQGCDVVINLAGAPINHRWTNAYKKQMYDSRVGVTKKLVEAINALTTKPELLISASAVGYYPSKGCFDEYNAEPAHGFLSQLCVEWEKASQQVSSDVRLVNTRFAVILSPNGGALSKMLTPFKAKIATIIDSGKQPFPWIDLYDHGRAIEHIIAHQKIKGVVNLIAPEQIDNEHFTRSLAKHFNCLATVHIPEVFFKLLMGESSQFLIEGQCVKPTKLLESGFVFESDTIEKFLEQRF